MSGPNVKTDSSIKDGLKDVKVICIRHYWNPYLDALVALVHAECN